MRRIFGLLMCVLLASIVACSDDSIPSGPGLPDKSLPSIRNNPESNIGSVVSVGAVVDEQLVKK